MGNFLIILTAILSSTVISALITGNISLHSKRKELEVKLRLEEKNKWIENISKAHKDYMENLTEYMQSLIEHTFKLADAQTIATKSNAITIARSTLMFFMYQSEYSSSLVEEVREIMQQNFVLLHKQDKIFTNYLHKLKQQDSKERTEDIQKDLGKQIGEIEEELAKNHLNLSEKLGIIVREEKVSMTTEIINRPFFK